MNRFCFALAITLAFGRSVTAQYVTLPDSNFVTWLQNNGYASCLTNDQLDTTCAAVTQAASLNCSNAGIADLTGVQYFDNLSSLNCKNNSIVALPPLPPSLSSLTCNNNQLTALPDLGQLSFLHCESNELTSLPELPSTLQVLRFYNNNVSSLGPLPLSLVTLDCRNNALTSLPQLPPNLADLRISVNVNMSDLPVLPSTLTKLHCTANGFEFLPVLPAGLKELLCNVNNLTTLPTLPPTLEYLDCNSNDLTALPELPQSLRKLSCGQNFGMTSLPALPDTLELFACPDNYNITCMPPLLVFTGGTNAFLLDYSSITCLPNVIQHTGFVAGIDTLPVCDIFNAGGCPVAWNVSGSLHIDIDNSCTEIASEPQLQNIKLRLSDGSGLLQDVYSDFEGQFSFDTNLGSYDVAVDTTDLPFSIYCPGNNNNAVDVTLSDSMLTDIDFALHCKPGYDVGAQAAVHTGIFFPAQVATVNIHAGDLVQFYGTACNTAGLLGTVTATYSGPVNVSSVSGNGLVAGNTITWNVSDFSQLDFFNDFWISFLTDTFAQAGEQVCLNVSIAANTGTDNNASNNTLTQCFDVVNSYDPNFKEVYPANISEPGEFHTYTVHFQNTGTAAAQHIQVIDTLDSNLDWSSFQLLAYSHDNLTQVKQNGIVHFNFPNIQLPDSTSDEPNSHGWIQYKLKTDSTITPGTTIHNTASIYFDFNDPVVTNDATVMYCLPQQSEQTLTLCDGDSVQVGSAWYHQAGSYTHAFNTANGCDSISITNVNVETIDTYVTQIGDSLSATANATSYQWIDCDSNQPVSGATSQTFTPLQNGSYAATLTYGAGCIATTSCYNVTSIGMENLRQYNFALFPNPTTGNVTLAHEAGLTNAFVQVSDLSGRVLYSAALSGKDITALALEHLASGTYWVRVARNDKIMATQKLTLIR